MRSKQRKIRSEKDSRNAILEGLPEPNQYLMSLWKNSNWGRRKVKSDCCKHVKTKKIRHIDNLIRCMEDYIYHRCSTSKKDSDFLQWLKDEKDKIEGEPNGKLPVSNSNDIIEIFRLLKQDNLIVCGHQRISKMLDKTFNLEYSQSTIYGMLKSGNTKSTKDITIE